MIGLLRCTQRALPLLRVVRGSIVNIGSLAGKVAPKYVGAYAATKHAVTAISQQLRLEVADQGVHVLHVCPGPIRRDDAGVRYDEQAGSLPDHAKKPGAGARIKGLDPTKLSQMILRATLARKRELIVPWKVRILLALGVFSARCGDWLLRKTTGG